MPLKYFIKKNLANSSTEICCTDSESSHVNQNEERLADNPVWLTGDIFYNYDLSDDDVLQIEVDLAGPSLVDLWKEDQLNQLQESNEPKQTIYDTDEESIKNVEDGEESLNLCSAS